MSFFFDVLPAAAAASGWGGAAVGATTAAAVAAPAVTGAGILGTIATGVSLASTLISGVGAYGKYDAAAKQAESQATFNLAQARYNKSVSDYNAMLFEDNAAEVRKVGAYNADLQRDKLKRIVGSQRLGYAVSGVELSSGSPMETMLQTIKDGEMDVQAGLYTNEMEARQWDKKASLTRLQGGAGMAGAGMSASLLEDTAGAYETSGILSGTSTILSGAAKTYRASTGKVSGYELIG